MHLIFWWQKLHELQEKDTKCENTVFPCAPISCCHTRIDGTDSIKRGFSLLLTVSHVVNMESVFRLLCAAILAVLPVIASRQKRLVYSARLEVITLQIFRIFALNENWMQEGNQAAAFMCLITRKENRNISNIVSYYCAYVWNAIEWLE